MQMESKISKIVIISLFVFGFFYRIFRVKDQGGLI